MNTTNRSVFSLIFDYRGRISNKEFLYGIMVLLFTASLLCSYELLGNSKIFNSFRLGINMRFWYQTNYVIYMFLPAAPLSAVIFYSSFVLAVKRLRSRGSGIIPGLIIGFLIFLGLKSIVIYVGNRYYREGWILIPFIPGLICVIILSLKNSYDKENNKFSEMLYSFSWYGKMSDKDYIAHLTKIYIWSVLSAAVYLGLLFIIAKTAGNKYEAIDTYVPFLVFVSRSFF